MALRKLQLLVYFLIGLVFCVDADIEYQSAVGENHYQGYHRIPDSLEESYRLWNTRETTRKPVENVDWRGPDNLGQISGVAVDSQGRPVIFHRGDRVWNYNTFSDNNEYREEMGGPIVENTVLTLNPQTGEIIKGWGNRTFYLPHGIHIDTHGNVWLTDIALHQVFKYDMNGHLLLTLGERFVPGDDLQHFCKPTSVAVANTGEILVADGYCNSRIIVFDRKGNPKFTIEKPWINFWVPHSLTILPNGETCVADREHSRIVCFIVDLHGYTGQLLQRPHFILHYHLDSIFGVASYGNIIYALDSGKMRQPGVGGFTVDPIRRKVIDVWGPETGAFSRPHAIAVDPNGTALYVSEIGPNNLWKFDLLSFDVTE